MLQASYLRAGYAALRAAIADHARKTYADRVFAATLAYYGPALLGKFATSTSDEV